MANSKLILFCFVCSFLFRCREKADNDESVLVDSIHLAPSTSAPTMGLPLANYMRIKDGKFQSGAEQGVSFTSRADLKRTFDHLITNDSNVVIYFHGGFMSVKKAFSAPVEIKLDSTFRSTGYFPFYVLYGASVKESLWTQRPTRFDEENTDERIDMLTNQAIRQKSFVYLLKQIERRVKHKSSSLVAYQYTPLDTADLQLEDLAAGNSITEQETEEDRFDISPRDEESFIRDLGNDKVLARLEHQDALRYAGLKSNGFVPDVVPGKLYRFLRIVNGVFRRVRSRRGHGLFSTCFEETIHNSSGLFLVIKTLVKDGWKRSKQIVEDPFIGNGNVAGGIALLDELVRLDSASKSIGRIRKIFLVGSSTGTILICNMLKKNRF